MPDWRLTCTYDNREDASMTMGIEFAVSGGGQMALAGIFGRTTSSLGSNSFAAAFGAQLESTTNTETDRASTAVASSPGLDSSGLESPELDSSGLGSSGTFLSGSVSGKQPAKLAGVKNNLQDSSPSSVTAASASAASSVTNLPATLLPPVPVPNVLQENVLPEQAPLSQGLSRSSAAGNLAMAANASSLNFTGELFSESAGSSISSSPSLTTGPSLVAATPVPSVSSVSEGSTAIHSGDNTAPLMTNGTAVDTEQQTTTAGALPPENNMTQAAPGSTKDLTANGVISSVQWAQPADATQQNLQPIATVTVTPTAQTTNVAAPLVAEVAASEVSISPTDFSSPGLQDSDAEAETAQQPGSTDSASTLSSILPAASTLRSNLSPASGANAPITNAAAVKASLPIRTQPGVGAPTTAAATGSGIPMQGEPVKAVFPGTVAPQGTPRNAPVTSIPKSVSVTSVGSTSAGPTPTDLSAAIQTHVANTLAGSSLELRASVTLAVGQSLDGIQSKASAGALSPAVPATNAQFGNTSPAVPAINPNAETSSTSNSSGSNSPAINSGRNLTTGKDSAPVTPSTAVSTTDAQANQSAAIAAQTAVQTSSPQAAAAVLAVPMSQNAAGQTAPATTSARPANESLPAGASGSPSTPAAPGELPTAATVGPVQVAQIASKAAQTEMRIGMNTSAFGSVEVRTTVHANDVGVVIGSEKGDLRSLLSNDLPGIANTLQQQNLRLNQVSFQQGAAFSGNSFSGNSSPGNGSQQRAFSPPQAMPYAELSSEIGLDDFSTRVESTSGSLTSFSILA
jgi:hypothetical protein